MEIMKFLKKLLGVLYKIFLIIRERFFSIPSTVEPPSPPPPVMGEGAGRLELVQEQPHLPGKEVVFEKRTKDFETPPLVEGHRFSVCDLLDRLLNTGVVVYGDITISVANVDLVYLDLRALICSAETARKLQQDTPFT